MYEEEGIGSVPSDYLAKRERARMSRELEVLREEYKRAVASPLFDDPKDYCVLLDLIQDRIDANVKERESND